MKIPSIDELKLEEVKEIIDKAACLIEVRDCDEDEEAREELENLRVRLKEVTGNEKVEVSDFQFYWSYTDLETVALEALYTPPEKMDVTDDQIREIVLDILKCNEAEMDYWCKFLKINTGLRNITDYIFYPDKVGLNGEASLEEIADKIITDRK